MYTASIKGTGSDRLGAPAHASVILHSRYDTDYIGARPFRCIVRSERLIFALERSMATGRSNEDHFFLRESLRQVAEGTGLKKLERRQ